MEDLNKNQIVLLTILISFVVSIGTGIITFSLISEAPVEITQTINRVVEKTIETVVQEKGGEVIKEVTVVVKEEDLVIDSIKKTSKNVVRIHYDSVGGPIFFGLGLLVSSDGLVVTHSKDFSTNLKYRVFLSDQSEVLASSSYIAGQGLVFIKLEGSAASGEDLPALTPATLGDSKILGLGQTVIGIAGDSRDVVSVGRISELIKDTEGLEVKLINTDISLKINGIGGPLINLSGEIVGFQTSFSVNNAESSFLPINSLKEEMEIAIEALK